MKTLRHFQEEDPNVGTVSNSLLWGRMAVETGWGEFKTFLTCSGSGPNIVENCSEESPRALRFGALKPSLFRWSNLFSFSKETRKELE